jgi:transformation/transcription domain-associated protein
MAAMLGVSSSILWKASFATYLPDLKVRSEAFIRKMAQIVFKMEVRHNEAHRGSRPVPTPLLSCFLDALPHALAHDQPEQAKKPSRW